MAHSLVIAATDAELPAMLRHAFQRCVFTTAEQLRATIHDKPGPLVIVLDATQADVVVGLNRSDVRAVVLLTPQKVPVVFGKPVVAVVERPLFAPKVLLAIKLALAELTPRGP